MTEHTDAEGRREVRLPIDVTQPIDLIVHAFDSEIRVRAAERPDVLVSHDAPRHQGFSDDRMTIDAQGNRIEIRPTARADAGWAGIPGDVDLDAVAGQIGRAFRRGASWASGFQEMARLFTGDQGWGEIVIEIPAAMRGRVEIHTTSGDMQIEAVAGEIALESMSGSARLRTARGDLSLRTASGNLTVENASGRLTAHSASGDVHISASALDGFTLQTASGDLLIDATLAGDGPFRAHTASGDIRLTLRQPATGEEPPAILTFGTVSGAAHVSAPFRAIGPGRWQAGANERGPRIEAATVSGDLSAEVATADHASAPSQRPMPPAAPEPPAAQAMPAQPEAPGEPAAPEGTWAAPVSISGMAAKRAENPPAARDDAERLAVLEAVERGEIDIEEALARLEAADVITHP